MSITIDMPPAMEREARKHRMRRLKTDNGQGLLVSLWDDHLAIERRDFLYGESLGDDRVVPLPVSKLLPSATFTFAAEDLPMKGHYRFEVRALECFGKKGGKIASDLIEV